MKKKGVSHQSFFPYALFILTYALSLIPKPSLAQGADTLCIKVASVYENISAGLGSITSGYADMPMVISQIKDSRTDFIFRAYWRWSYAPDSVIVASDTSYEQKGLTYNQLRQAIQRIKDSIPGIKICGAVPAQKINFIEVDDLTGDTLNSTQTWQMGINPQKWGIPITEQQLMDSLGNWWPDITNMDYQKLLLDWIKKQISCGVDAIWIDLLYAQAKMLYGLSGNINHISVQQSYNAATAVVDSIHNYASSIGKYIYVGTWSGIARSMPYAKPQLDFVTETVSNLEILNDTLNPQWTSTRNSIINTFGNIPILIFIDWGGNNTRPLDVFSQQLTTQNQKNFLAKADTFFYNRNITFTYPMVGGTMGISPSLLSFGIYNNYCSFAPEFNTYDTIKTLGMTKSLLSWYCQPTTTAKIEEPTLPSKGSINILIYPNPSSGMIYILNLPEMNADISVINLQGQLVCRNKNSGKSKQMQMNLSTYPKGIYFLKIVSEKYSCIEKLVIE